MVASPRVSGLRLESTNAYPALPFAHRSWSVSVCPPEFDRRPDLSLLGGAALLGGFRKRATSTVVRLNYRER
jgi:hypothetical protein